MKCLKFSPLLRDMQKHNIDKEHYSFTYKSKKFDVILAIVESGSEILIAIHSDNWGCALKMDELFNVQMDDITYYRLCKILNLTWKKDGFNSDKFLFLLSEKAPRKSGLQGVSYETMRLYTRYRIVSESDKIYFCGWNDHRKGGKKAHNFDKTEFYFGYQVAEYCRRHNISSMWTDIPANETKTETPWS